MPPPLNPCLAPCDFHAFGPIKCYGNERYKNDEEVKNTVRNWQKLDNIFSMRLLTNLFESDGMTNVSVTLAIIGLPNLCQERDYSLYF